METRIVKERVPKEKWESWTKEGMLKVVVDIEKEILSIGCELHVDCADQLIQAGSLSTTIWGANVYPDGRIDFLSLINIRPPLNRSQEIQNEEIRGKVEGAIKNLLPI